MQPFHYHDGQRAIQVEANSVACADSLATWVGPVAEFARIADLVVMASVDGDHYSVGALSGAAPLVNIDERDGNFTAHFPLALSDILGTGGVWGGIVINLAQARRARISGTPAIEADHVSMPCETAFVNCRKYMVPTAGVGEALSVGPARAEALEFDDPWIAATIADAETAFLISASPNGAADASHRGGFPGFLRYDHVTHTIAWTDYLGDGMFVSMGNVRSSGHAVLVVLELDTGHALRLDLDATYTTLRTDRHERVDALLQAGEPHPVQGRVVALITRAERLVDFCHPRTHVSRKQAYNSTHERAVQHPQ